MPTNPQHLLQGIRDFRQSLAASHSTEKSAGDNALRLLQHLAGEAAELGSRVEAAASDASLRCAAPFKENIAASVPAPVTAPPSALLAVDGSQIVPDRHAEILFGLINTGAVIFVPGSGAAPTISSATKLLHGEQVFGTSNHLLSEGDMALLRDAAERRSLAHHAQAPGSIALTDGTLELWGPKDPGDQRAFDRALSEYVDQLHELRHRDITVAGYVDRPGADLVTRMLEVGAPESARALGAHRGRFA